MEESVSTPVRTRQRPRVVDDVGVSPWRRSPVRRQARHDEEDLDRAAVVAAETAVAQARAAEAAVAQARADLDARAAVGAAFDACDEADAALAVFEERDALELEANRAAQAHALQHQAERILGELAHPPAPALREPREPHRRRGADTDEMRQAEHKAAAKERREYIKIQKGRCDHEIKVRVRSRALLSYQETGTKPRSNCDPN